MKLLVLDGNSTITGQMGGTGVKFIAWHSYYWIMVRTDKVMINLDSGTVFGIVVVAPTHIKSVRYRDRGVEIAFVQLDYLSLGKYPTAGIWRVSIRINMCIDVQLQISVGLFIQIVYLCPPLEYGAVVEQVDIFWSIGRISVPRKVTDTRGYADHL